MNYANFNRLYLEGIFDSLIFYHVKFDGYSKIYRYIGQRSMPFNVGDYVSIFAIEDNENIFLQVVDFSFPTEQEKELILSGKFKSISALNYLINESYKTYERKRTRDNKPK